jgi:transmembrane secretion effector
VCALIIGTLIMPKLRQKMSIGWLIGLATIVFAGVAFGLAFIRDFWSVCAIMAVGGIGWVTVVSSLKVSTQRVSPAWVRARTLALYLLVFEGAMALGSAAWGALAGYIGIPMTLAAAAVGLLLGLLAMFRFRLQAGEALALDPSRHWETLSVADEAQHADALERGPVMVMVEYRIEPTRTDAFRVAMQEVRAERLRDGAIFWGLFVDTSAPERYVEFFTLEAWLEHLRQHERVTATDRAVEGHARDFHQGGQPPVVTHFVAGAPLPGSLSGVI